MFRTPHINADTLQTDWNKTYIDTVHWERRVPWKDVAKQQGSVERVVPASEA